MFGSGVVGGGARLLIVSVSSSSSIIGDAGYCGDALFSAFSGYCGAAGERIFCFLGLPLDLTF
jgi:hypothetical protein